MTIKYELKCKCEGQSRCIYCGGTGTLVREVWDRADRMIHMREIGLVRGPMNERDPWTNRFTGRVKQVRS